MFSTKKHYINQSKPIHLDLNFLGICQSNCIFIQFSIIWLEMRENAVINFNKMATLISLCRPTINQRRVEGNVICLRIYCATAATAPFVFFLCVLCLCFLHFWILFGLWIYVLLYMCLFVFLYSYMFSYLYCSIICLGIYSTTAACSFVFFILCFFCIWMFYV